ncbi:outer membrane receptor protein [Ferrigenium kumadai]|uniref:Outer membrane receptor protein n=1 Tax=Ferrigenium kumadai TaxID=1682490 RepID=A0AAN1W0G4_9PROT|nr:TonB-dependent receptor [Ferrigenium kumadai]BBJ00444.1 outer membrane receptor protein [Ferrigenium kumadai]
MKQNRLFAAILCAVSPLSCAAADDVPDEIVVTATRIAQPLKQSLSSTTVITQQEIRSSQAVDVPSILRSMAGVEISRTGGFGKTSALYLRGSSQTEVVVLLDGVRINSATNGMTSIQELMLDQIERIEVVRGNVSSLYGSEAIGGVVQIFTRRGRGAPHFNLGGGAGNPGTQRMSAGFGGAVEATDFNVQLSAFKTDGVSAIDPAVAPKANPDRDGYRNASLSANVRHAFNADHSLSATLFGSRGRNQYDSAFGVATDLNTNTAGVSKFSLSSDNRFSDIWQSRVQLAQGVDDYQDYKNGLPLVGGHYKTTQRQISWQNTVQVGDGSQLLLGAEHLAQVVTADKAFAQTRRNVNSLFAGYTGNFGAHQLQANLREDRSAQFGAPSTGLLGYGYSFSDAWRATASYSTAFKAPTFNELYFPAFGNPALRPERARSAEAGLHYSVGSQQVDVVYFDNHVRDLVVYAPTPVNLNQARIDGVELSYAGQFGDTGIKAALTSQNPRDAVTGQQLVRRARLHSSLGVSQRFGAWQIGGEWLHSDAREDSHITAFPVRRVVLPGYDALNLTASYAIDKAWKLSLSAANFTNQNDATAHGYNPLGRTLFVGINYQP